METGIRTLNISGSDGFLIMCFWLRYLVISALVAGVSQQNTDWGDVMKWYYRRKFYVKCKAENRYRMNS